MDNGRWDAWWKTADGKGKRRREDQVYLYCISWD